MSESELFRFMTLRSPRRAGPANRRIVIDIDDGSRLHDMADEIASEAAGRDERKGALSDAARLLLGNSDFFDPTDIDGRLELLTRSGAGLAPRNDVAVERGATDTVIVLKASRNPDAERLAAAALTGRKQRGLDAIERLVRVQVGHVVGDEERDAYHSAPIVLRSAFLESGPPADEGETDYRMPSFGPVGVGVVYVVEQKLLRYERGEVAHVENIMRGETRERSHEIRRRTEDVLLVEEEEETKTEDDLETAERFEMQSETQRQIDEESELSLGLTVTARYGPSVEATASAEYSSRTATSESRTHASRFAQDIISRSAKQVRRRVFERRQRTTLVETIERNLHRFEGGGEHTVGIYQFLDQIYEYKMVEYEQRLMFEFIVPEPARWLAWAFGRKDSSATDRPEKPVEPRVGGQPLTPDVIDENNYQELAARFGVVDVDPPPPEEFVVTHRGFDQDAGEEGDQRVAKAGDVKLPADGGYEAFKAHITLGMTVPGEWVTNIDPDTFALRAHPSERNAYVAVGIGRHQLSSWWAPDAPRAHEATRTVDLDGETEQVPYYVYGRHDDSFAFTIEVECRLTEVGRRKWRHSVYDAIWKKYEERLAAYRDAMAQHEARQPAPSTTLSVPPSRLREIERTELKRRAMSFLDSDNLRRGGDPPREFGEGALVASPVFGGDGVSPLEEGRIETDYDGLDRLAPKIRFFEQAFEWRHMTYHLYPYYWADEDAWEEMALTEHPDPLHEAFLRAGAARVLVPVRPSHQTAVHYFLWSRGVIPNDLEAPLITDDAWLPVAIEIAEATGAPLEPVGVESCWTVRLPTRLIALSETGELPTFPASTDCPDNGEPDSPD